MEGLAFHCHHDTLFEYCSDYDERVAYIKKYKPEGEQELRLRLFKIIPKELIPGRGNKKYEACVKARNACDKATAAHGKAWDAYDKAWDAYDKARDAYDKARNACGKAWVAYSKAWAAYFKVWDAYVKARDAYDKAWAACGKARDDYYKKNKRKIEILHDKLCPHCPWDGETIFS